MNASPTIARMVEREFEKDPVSARTEYGAEFREGVSDYISPEILDACTQAGVKEIEPEKWTNYVAFCDPAGGSGKDGMTLAIAHTRADGVAVLDAVREASPPFSPDDVTVQFCELLKAYRIATVIGDNYAGEWPKERFRKNGITYIQSDKVRSEIYQTLVPALNSRRVRLLDVPKLRSQIANLERTTTPGGRDSINHPAGQHDDLANAAAGALIQCGRSTLTLMDLYNDTEDDAEYARALRRSSIDQGSMY